MVRVCAWVFSVDAESVGAELLPFMFAQQKAIGLLYQVTSFLRLKFELYQRAYGSHAAFRLFEPPNEAALLQHEAAVPSLLQPQFTPCELKNSSTNLRPADLHALVQQSLVLPLLLRCPPTPAEVAVASARGLPPSLMPFSSLPESSAVFVASFAELSLAHRHPSPSHAPPPARYAGPVLGPCVSPHVQSLPNPVCVFSWYRCVTTASCRLGRPRPP